MYAIWAFDILLFHELDISLQLGGGDVFVKCSCHKFRSMMYILLCIFMFIILYEILELTQGVLITVCNVWC